MRIVGRNAGIGGGLGVFDHASVPHMGDTEFTDGGKHHIVYLIHFSNSVGGDIAIGNAFFASIGVETRKKLIDYRFHALLLFG